ncbi:SIR2 family NAD-dependent protein deacylase [Segetibacter koreensis]|uniref:SIR2 family NAD-dependent protein deacylase n=1 Tax=Segetibacter koreensis TaxID=398037 RepID=UPI000381C019|nr:Sir2 family NAD-dependent protein deacetylase [Segetibacter koreensis]
MRKKKLVVLTGAGISAESGLKTFRDTDGLWEGYNVYEVATPTGFEKNPELVLDFYNMRRKDVAAAKPNEAHTGLAELEKDFDVTVITQNIDDLHERGGSSNIIHLHGEIFKMRSVTNSNLIYDIRGDINIGDLAEDAGQLRPHIVWFDELVPKIEDALEVMSTAEIFVVIGTSLLVYPAAGLVNYAPANIPKFIIDKNIPYTRSISNVTVIEKPATEGVKELKRILSEFT